MPCVRPNSMDEEELLLTGSTLLLGNEEELLKASATARDVLLLDREGSPGQLGASAAIEEPSLLTCYDEACVFLWLKSSGIVFRHLQLHLFEHGLIGQAGWRGSTPPRRQRGASGYAHSSLRLPLLRAYRCFRLLPLSTLLLRLQLLLLREVW